MVTQLLPAEVTELNGSLPLVVVDPPLSRAISDSVFAADEVVATVGMITVLHKPNRSCNPSKAKVTGLPSKALHKPNWVKVRIIS